MKLLHSIQRDLLAALLIISGVFLAQPSSSAAATTEEPSTFLNSAQGREWLARWEKDITGTQRNNRYCDQEMGEELGWLVSPFLNGFYYGYLTTKDPKWVEPLIDWSDSCIRRGMKEPDGYIGWPKGNGGGGESKEYSADSLLGEAMMLRPVVLMADVILKTPSLKEKFGDKAAGQTHLKSGDGIH